MSSFFTEEELKAIPFKSIGKNVKISRKASIYTPEGIEIGDNVRIDDFCILSGKIKIGNHIHIAAYSALYGKYGIIIEDFVNISGRVSIYSSSDDYSGEYLISPVIPEEFTGGIKGTVILKKHSIIGAGTIVMPNLIIGEGTAVGALSFVNKSLKDWYIYLGIPAKPLKPRKKNILELEKKFLEFWKKQ